MLKLQYFCHLMLRTDSLENTLMLEKIGDRRRGWQSMRGLDGITDSMDMRVWVSSGSWWWTGKPGVLQSMGSQRVGHDWATELNCTDVWMWELDYKKKLSAEELMLLNCGVGEDSWKSLDCKKIKPVNPKGNQSWIFIGRTDAETPILLPSNAKNWLLGKDPDAGKDWRQEEKGTTEDKMVGWHYRLEGH